MATTYKFVRGDTLPQLGVTLTRDDGTVVDLTGTTVNLHVKAQGAPSVSFTKVATITDATGGAFVVAWNSGDLDLAAGIYEAEIELIRGGDTETVYDLIRLQIRDDIA